MLCSFGWENKKKKKFPTPFTENHWYFLPIGKALKITMPKINRLNLLKILMYANFRRGRKILKNMVLLNSLNTDFVLSGLKWPK